ncbi:MAG: PAS domain S-box protein, partial [Gallionella sp.]|nr:PAS domain S-box protein [Gallionella sp.]
WRRIPDGWFEPKRMAEAILLFALAFLAGQIVFLGWFQGTDVLFKEVAKGYWIFLFVSWLAVRFGTGAVVIALVMVAIQALLGAALGVGFFANDMAKTGLINYWFYIITLSVVGMVLAIHFTERKRAEDALRESEENLNRAQAVGQIGSWLLNIPTNRLEWSAETYRMFGIPQQQAIDLETFVAITHPDDRDFVLKAWGEALAGAPYDIEHRIMAGGQERWVRERARIERDAEEHPLVGIGTVQDITERKQLEVAQLESEELYHSLFENMLNGFAYCQMIFEGDQPQDFIYLSVNAAFETLTGLKNVVGKRVSEVVPGIQQTDARLFELYGRVSLSGKPERLEIYLKALQKWFWISVYSPQKGYFAVTFDVITERKQAEEKLRASEQKFMRLFMEIPIPLGVADEEGVIAYFNNKFTEAFGYTVDDVPTLNEWWLKAYPDETYRRWVLDNWNDAVAKATKEGTNVESAEYRVACKNGAERIVIIGGSSVDGGVLAIFNDITERKRMNEELELFRLLVERSGDPIFMIDDDDGCRMMYVNEAAVKHYGATREEILTWRIPDWDPNFTYEKLDEHVEEIKKLKNLTIESLHRVKGGSIVPVEITLNYMLYEGKVCHFGYFRNITERKEHEEELKRSNVDLEQFSYAVSHDMRQPLRMISSYLQLLERSLAGQLDSEKCGYFDIAIEGAKRIDQMLVELLEYSRIGRMGEPPTLIDSRAVLDEALQFLQPAIAEAQAKVDISGEWPYILASHDEILRLLQNLIGNAIKFRIAGQIPEITVTSGIVKNEWHLCVADNGVGIIPDQIKRLFQVFQRLQSREVYEGTGIGLALCRKIAEHHKGRIWAESAGEDQGSRFYVVLPVLQIKIMSQ